MKKIVIILAVLIAAYMALSNLGPVPILILVAASLLIAWVVNSMKHHPAKAWNLVQALAFTGMLFGGLWTVIGLFAFGIRAGALGAIVLFGLYMLRQFAKRKMRDAGHYSAYSA